MSVDACAALVAKGDPARFASAMYAQGQGRADLLVLYAFNLEVARAPWVTQEEMIAEMRLQWWLDALAEIGAGGTVRRHEVVTPLAALVTRRGLDVTRLQGIVTARRFDIYRDTHEDRAAFDAFLAATSGTLTEQTARVLGSTQDATAEAFGAGLGAANLLQALPALVAHGRNPLPLSRAEHQSLHDGNPDDVVLTCIRQVAKTGQDRLAAARQDRKAVPKAAHAAFLAGWQADETLALASRDPLALLTRDWTGSSRWRLGWRYLTGLW